MVVMESTLHLLLYLQDPILEVTRCELVLETAKGPKGIGTRGLDPFDVGEIAVVHPMLPLIVPPHVGVDE
jgi:hypothetical protein